MDAADARVVLQVGFGLGQAFLHAWHDWRQDAGRATRLDFIALTPAPPTAEALCQAHRGGALQVLAEVDNPGALLKPGMFARPRVVFSQRVGAVVVPEEALVPLGASQFVFKVVDGAEGQKVAQRLEARVGLRQPGKVEIVEGLQAGDIVVTAGQARLLRGDRTPVRLIDLAQAGAAVAAAPARAPRQLPGAASAARPAQP